MNKLEFRMMIGISGSGKSTIANELGEKHNAIIISTDGIRKEIYGDENCQTDHSKVFALAHSRILGTIKSNDNVIFDATNLSYKDRKQIIEKVKLLNCEIIAECCVCDIDIAIKRDSERNRIVGEEVIIRQVKKYQAPHWVESFDKINFIETSKQSEKHTVGYINSLRCQMNDFDQKTKWHKFPLKMHCDLCVENLLEKKVFNHQVLSAAKIHDIGKLFTQSPNVSGGMSYLNHENYGAYILSCAINALMFSDSASADWIEIIFYVNNHMLPFALKNAKPQTIEKYKTFFGKERFDNLILFNECDKLASGIKRL